MSIEGLIACLIVFLATIGLMALPFLGRKTLASSKQAQLLKQRDELLTNYERVVASIRDLDDDHLTGKLDDDTYERERTVWSERGVQVLAALDELGMGSAEVKQHRKNARKAAAVANGNGNGKHKETVKPAAEQSVSAEAELDDAVEAAIARYAESLKAKQ